VNSDEGCCRTHQSSVPVVFIKSGVHSLGERIVTLTTRRFPGRPLQTARAPLTSQ
jgi:hypothetical protein